jgi:hypothetical protein
MVSSQCHSLPAGGGKQHSQSTDGGAADVRSEQPLAPLPLVTGRLAMGTANGGPSRRAQDGSDSGIGSGIRSRLVGEVRQKPVHAEAGDALDAKDCDDRQLASRYQLRHYPW